MYFDTFSNCPLLFELYATLVTTTMTIYLLYFNDFDNINLPKQIRLVFQV